MLFASAVAVLTMLVTFALFPSANLPTAVLPVLVQASASVLVQTLFPAFVQAAEPFLVSVRAFVAPSSRSSLMSLDP